MTTHFFKGSSVEQDGRRINADQALMLKMEKNGLFDPILKTKINLKRCNIPVISKWINTKLNDILGYDDDIVKNLIINLLELDDLDGKKLQYELTGFLEKQTGSFCKELWDLLIDAQEQANGIPLILLDMIKENESKQKKIIQSDGNDRRTDSRYHRNNSRDRSYSHDRNKVDRKDRDSRDRNRGDSRDRRRGNSRDRYRENSRNRNRDRKRYDSRDRDRKRYDSRDRDRKRYDSRDRERHHEIYRNEDSVDNGNDSVNKDKNRK